MRVDLEEYIIICYSNWPKLFITLKVNWLPLSNFIKFPFRNGYKSDVCT